ncbi:MAG: winged helix-turn-helix domain-containing protein [Lachnospiraceae bacterium]|nr:winged helix-turn-helix domain-containing protein [Lachnospiraceae bacterium]
MPRYRNSSYIIWNYEYLGDHATISKHISSIRKKIGDSSIRQFYIQTIRGVGYRFNKNLKRSAKGK